MFVRCGSVAVSKCPNATRDTLHPVSTTRVLELHRANSTVMVTFIFFRSIVLSSGLLTIALAPSAPRDVLTLPIWIGRPAGTFAPLGFLDVSCPRMPFRMVTSEASMSLPMSFSRIASPCALDPSNKTPH